MVGLILPDGFAEGAAKGQPADDQNLARQCVGRQADRNCIKASGDQRRQTVPLFQGQHQCHWTGPEGIGQRLGHLVPDNIAMGGLDTGQVHDQRVETGASLGLVDRGHRRIVPCITGKAIDRLGGQRDEAPFTEKVARMLNACVGIRQNLGVLYDHSSCDAAFRLMQRGQRIGSPLTRPITGPKPKAKPA